MQITIYEDIVNFEVKVKYFEKYTHVLKPGLGILQNKVPLGREVTLGFEYTSGTVDKLITTNVTNGLNALIDQYEVTDKFDARQFLINLTFASVSDLLLFYHNRNLSKLTLVGRYL